MTYAHGYFREELAVTELVADETVHAREEQLRLAMDAAEIGLWDLDMTTGTLFWPPRVKAMFGISPDVPVSMEDFYNGLHADDRAAVSASFAAACDSRLRALYDVEYRTVGKEDGRLRWVAAKGRGVFDQNGFCVRVIGTAIDITARKAAEAALIESKEKLREAHRRKDEFLATLAHELRNPLAPVRTSIEFLSSSEEAKPVHAVMTRQVHHLVRLVDDLLETARITNGTFELTKQPVELSTFIRHALEVTQRLMMDRGHALDVHLPADPAWVEGDEVRLVQILSNLLNNAARYTPSGGRIGVHAYISNSSAVVTVSDSGVGFPPDRAPELFEMFHRGADSSGLGVGLALSRQLAEMHGGKLEAQSDGPGRGATFTLTIPTSGLASPVENPILEVQRPVAGSETRVLVVDDNEDGAEMLALLFRGAGLQVRVAYDGKAGLEEAASYKPQVVIADIGMPGMDGYELARRLRALFSRAETLIIGVSGWGQPEDVRRGLEAGFDHHLVKPVDADKLLKLIEKIYREE